MPSLDDWSLVGDRVRTARIASGRSQAEIGAAIGIDRTAVGRVESGDRRLSLLEAAVVAEEVSVDLSVLLADRVPAVTSRRRSPTDDSRPEQRAARVSVLLEQHAADTAWLVQRAYLKVPSTGAGSADRSQRLDGAGVVSIARQARRRAGVPDLGPVGELAEVAEALDIYLRSVSDDVGGASLHAGDWSLAVVGEPEPGRRRMTAAHEIGHQVLGDEYSVDLGVAASTDDRERAIDRFAAEFLLPGEVVTTRVAATGGEPVVETLIRLAVEYRVSWGAVVHRAVDVGVVPRAGRQDLLDRSPTRGDLMRLVGREVPADLVPGSTGPRWTTAVLNAYASGDLGEQRALRLLGGRFRSGQLPRRGDDDLW